MCDASLVGEKWKLQPWEQGPRFQHMHRKEGFGEENETDKPIAFHIVHRISECQLVRSFPKAVNRTRCAHLRKLEKLFNSQAVP